MKVGIITFHASYNFGSVMQAYALQRTIEKLGYESEIINFRPVAQKRKYSIVSFGSNWKSVASDILNIRYLRNRLISHRKFESFINDKLKCSEEISYIKGLDAFKEKYDIYISGSDQIWAYRVPEYVFSKEDIRPAYFLSFTNKPKLSYGSSTGVSELSEIKAYKDFLMEYRSISVRENRGKEIIEELTGKTVTKVLDPTYLISSYDWKNEDTGIKPINNKYVLIYSLQGMKKRKKWKELIKKLSLSDCSVIAVSPFAPIKDKNILDYSFAGPLETLELFKNAYYVFTDTFHGMSFSIHMRKPFCLLETSKIDDRKRDVLSALGFESRVAYNVDAAVSLFEKNMNYDCKERTIENDRQISLNYLKKSIKEAGCCERSL